MFLILDDFDFVVKGQPNDLICKGQNSGIEGCDYL